MQNKTLMGCLVVAGLAGLFGCGGSPSTPGTPDSSAGNSAASGGSALQANKAIEPAPAPRPPVVVGAGTGIVVTADQSVSSKTSNSGDHFEASLAAPVMVNGKEVIPSGAKATGTVTDAKSAGKFKGNAEISVTLTSVMIGGQQYSVKTTSVTESGKGRGQRTAVGAGGGAAVGAIIGAIAGHGKGAAIGAAAGAGAGTAGAAMTGERDVTIAAETKLNFKLVEPLEIKRK
jgi:hypothetical protein